MVCGEPAARPSGKNASRSTNMTSPVEQPNGGRVAKNTTYLTLALIGQKVLSAVYIPLVAALIGPSATGDYLAALSFVNLFTVFIDLGLTPAFIRQTARDRQAGERHYQYIITLKLLTSLLVVGALAATVVIIQRSGLSHPNKLFLSWAAIGMIIDSLALTLYGFFRGIQRLEFESIGTMIHRVVVMIVGLTALQFHAPTVVVMIALVAGSSANFLYASFHLWRQNVSWRWRLDGHIWPLLRTALPFFVAALFVAIYSTSDNILLQLFKGHREVGLYGTAFKVINAFAVLPAALVAAIYPAMSAAYVDNREKLGRIFRDAMQYLMVIFIPVMIILFVLGHELIVRFYHDVWADAAWPLRVLAVGIPFVFLNYPVGYLLNAANRQTRNTVNTGITVAVNIGLNLLFIKEFSYKSVALISVFSSALLFGLGLYSARRIITIPWRAMGLTFMKTLVAGGILAAVGYYLLPHAGSKTTLLGLAAGLAALYAGLSFLLRIVTKEEVTALLGRLRRSS